jgi:SAM-dependent methyltransferase
MLTVCSRLNLRSLFNYRLSAQSCGLEAWKAAAQQISNVDFRLGDMVGLHLPEATFDAVVCVFGIFFVPDMPAAARALWQLVRPGGVLAITTWGPQFLEPGNSAFWNSIREVRPELYKEFNPWDRICEPSAALAVLREAGVENAQAIAEYGEHALASADAWWCAVLGSGYRGTLEQLSPTERDQVHRVNLDFIERSGIRSVAANVIYATAVRS